LRHYNLRDKILNELYRVGMVELQCWSTSIENLFESSLLIHPGSWAGLIWRVDLHVADGKPNMTAYDDVWLEHDSMGYLAKLLI
jgi:hypothetical protein